MSAAASRARLAGLLVAGLIPAFGVAARTPGQTLPAAAAPVVRTARDGVFTTEQVERGRTAYNAQCARCHGETLGGGETSPALVDERFFAAWAGRSVGELVERTRLTMPSDGPGRIPRRRCIDIAAFVLSANGFPAGDQELPTELDVLNQITITRAK